MAFSELNPSNEGQYNTGQFTDTPDVYRDANPDPRVLPELGGWSPTANNEMYFKLTSYPNAQATVGLSTLDKTMVIQVTAVRRQTLEITYWKVNTGTDNRSTAWELSFDVYNDIIVDDQYTGKWKFSKGKVNEDLVV